MAVCDCKGVGGHTSLTKGSHDLPEESGPLHEKSWGKIQKLTKAALEAAKSE
jgi:hypothetical protein